jgi:hypothetical protein
MIDFSGIEDKLERNEKEEVSSFSLKDLDTTEETQQFTVESSSMDKIKETISSEYTSPTLEENKGKNFTFNDMENRDTSLKDFDEEKAQKEEEEKVKLSEEEIEDFSELIVEGFDWGVDKLFGMFGYKVHETRANDKKKAKVQNALTKVLAKMSIRFSAELLLLFVTAFYLMGKFLNAEKIEETEVEKPVQKNQQRKPVVRNINEQNSKREIVKDKFEKKSSSTKISTDTNKGIFG